MTIRTYSELNQIKTFEERFRYLQLNKQIGIATFGFDRYINQNFYTSRQWKIIRNHVIVRDRSCDLGIAGRDIYGYVRVHHMNPIAVEDLEQGNADVLDPEFLICTSLDTHNAIHFGNESNIFRLPVERTKGDTRLW